MWHFNPWTKGYNEGYFPFVMPCTSRHRLVLGTRYNVFLGTAHVSQSLPEGNILEHVNIRDRRRYLFPGKRRTSSLSEWTFLKAGKAFLASSFQNRPSSLFVYTSSVGKLSGSYAGGLNIRDHQATLGRVVAADRAAMRTLWPQRSRNKAFSRGAEVPMIG